MPDPVAFAAVAPGLFRVGGFRDARAVLADRRLVHWVARDAAPNPVAGAIARWLDAMDPRHGHPARKGVIAALSPAASAALRPELEHRAAALLEALAGDASFDIERDFARPLTYGLVADVLGIASVHRPALDPLLDALGDQIPRGLFPMLGQPCDTVFFQRWEQAVRTGMDGQGLATALEDVCESDDFGIFTAMFAFAATGNIARFVARAAHGFAARPALWAALRDDPAALPGALEEWLRFDPPLPVVHLVAGEPLGGGAIAAGDSILVALADAHRDAGVFADPHTFDPRRGAPHLAFGSGPLSCIGAAVARMLAQVAVGRLIANYDPADALAYPAIRVQPRGAHADATT
jgi:cytochrome P450